MNNEGVIKQAISEEIFGLTIINESEEDRTMIDEIFNAVLKDDSFLFEKLLVGEPVSVPEIRKLLRKKILNFEFIKLDGEVRPARGTTMMKYIPQKDHPKGIRPSSPKVATFFDLDKKAWRSISNKSKEIVLKYAFGEKEKPVFVVKDKEEKPEEKPDIEPKVEKPTEEPDVQVKDVDIEEKPVDDDEVEVKDVEVEEKPSVDVKDVEIEEKPGVEVKDVEVEEKPDVDVKDVDVETKDIVKPIGGRAVPKSEKPEEPKPKPQPKKQYGFTRKQPPQPKFGFKPKEEPEQTTVILPTEVETSQFDQDENLPPAKNPPLDIETEDEV